MLDCSKTCFLLKRAFEQFNIIWQGFSDLYRRGRNCNNGPYSSGGRKKFGILYCREAIQNQNEKSLPTGGVD